MKVFSGSVFYIDDTKVAKVSIVNCTKMDGPNPVRTGQIMMDLEVKS